MDLSAIPVVQQLIEMALTEDIGPGDITSDNLIPEDQAGEGIIIAKEPMVVAGLEVAASVFEWLDPDADIYFACRDGDHLESGSTVVELNGRMRALLKGERTALNFLQRLSGIATHVNRYVKEVKDLPVRIVDTRKTTPGLRVLEKYAVRVGGAHNHRTGLFDGVLIKDNHIAACGGIAEAVQTIRGNISHLVKIEVEVSSPGEVDEALGAGADVIMLDNMDPEQIRAAVKRIDGNALVEVSGGVTMENILSLAQSGVDIVSIGALTHSAVAVDLSMRIQQV